MQFTSSIDEIIPVRRSCRNFDPCLIETEKIQKIQLALTSKKNSPFGKEGVHFTLIELSEIDQNKRHDLANYSNIQGMQYTIAGAVRKSKYDCEHYAYLLEKIVLYLTSLGLVTCWIGSNFKEEAFRNEIDARESEIIPAIIPIGYPANKLRLYDKVIKLYLRPHKRKEWKSLFFLRNFNTVLSKEKTEMYAIPLEMLRLSPSSKNRQPWRVIKESETHTYHFYIHKKDSKMYLSQIDLKRLDIGIAICHFDLSIKELGLKGKYLIENPKLSVPENLKYVITWKNE